jgi:hypothetical protein
MPSELSSVGQGSTEGNTFLFIKDPTIIGLEADIMIPNAGNQNEAGIYLNTMDINPLGSLGFELRKTATGSSFNYDYFNDQGSKILGYEAGSLDTFHKIKITELNGQTSYYLDNKLIKQFASTSHDSDYWGIGSFSDNGMAYNTYADNVRVLRKWEDYDDFSGSTLNTNKWDVSCWDGGNLPIISNGQALLAGKTNSSWNSTIATARMLASNSNAVNMLAGGEAHSVLEFKESDDIYGIELDLILPLDIPSNCGIGIYAIDYNEMFNGNAEDSIRFDLDLWHSSSTIGNPEVQISWGNLSTGKEEKANSIKVSNGTPIKLAFIRSENVIEFFYNNQSVAKANYKNVSETFIVRSVSEQGHKFDTYLDNVRVLRRSSNLPLINVAPAKIEGSRDLVYLQSPSGSSLLAGACEINFDLELTDRPTVSAATLKVDGNVFDITQNQGPTAFRTRYGYRTGEPNELYDIESSSTSDWSVYVNGKRFEFDLLIGGNQYTYSHDLPGEAELPTPPSPSISGAGSWKKDQSSHDYVEVSEAENYVVSWDPFVTSDSNDFIVVSLVEQIGDEEKDILGDVNLTVATSSYEISGNLLEKNKSYLFYVGFSNVVQSENPAGFTHSTDSNTTKPLLRTSANSITAIAFMVKSADPVTVVSDPSGKAVVVQVENEYKWNSSLDGVTLWTVAKSSDGWGSMTMRFENGRNYGNKGFYDSIALPQTYDMPFVIDENGYIKVTETSGYQYYNAVSVENGIVGTIQNDEGPASVANNGSNQVDQWFFTTRAAAEEYYYSKVNPKDWLWFDRYPWVYSNERQDWLYFMPSGGKLMYYSHKYKAWREFSQ